ncbi:MAG: NAD(P)-dependent oxidoreductase [bacterium]|nr:NAD(P)-dependent oxidoreductase [bacterium]
MKKTNILITGANGFVGSKIIEALMKNKRYRIAGLVRKTSNLDFLKGSRKRIKLYFGDIRSKETLLEAFKGKDIVIHAAAFPSDWGSFDYFYETNVKGTRNVCELCLQNSVKHLVYISSVSIYGFGKRINACESSEVRKNKFPYCVTKLEGEETVRHFIDVFRLPATIVQPGQIYGPHDRTTSYKVIEALNQGLFGLCDSGRHLLSPVYIDNLVQAIVRILNKPAVSLKKTYVVTDNIRITWKEFTGHFCRILNKPMPWLNLPRQLAFLAASVSEAVYRLLMIRTPPSCYLIQGLPDR